jgi:hypothetical protein
MQENEAFAPKEFSYALTFPFRSDYALATAVKMGNPSTTWRKRRVSPVMRKPHVTRAACPRVRLTSWDRASLQPTVSNGSLDARTVLIEILRGLFEFKSERVARECISIARLTLLTNNHVSQPVLRVLRTPDKTMPIAQQRIRRNGEGRGSQRRNCGCNKRGRAYLSGRRSVEGGTIAVA